MREQSEQIKMFVMEQHQLMLLHQPLVPREEHKEVIHTNGSKVQIKRIGQIFQVQQMPHSLHLFLVALLRQSIIVEK